MPNGIQPYANTGASFLGINSGKSEMLYKMLTCDFYVYFRSGFGDYMPLGVALWEFGAEKRRNSNLPREFEKRSDLSK